MYALSAATGSILWETYLVPRNESDPNRGPAGAMPQSAVATWKNAPDVPISGGGTWTSYTLDPATGRLYVPAANPSPDFVSSLREGENLYTDSVVILDANTGGYLNHFQIVPRDWHDWDVSNAPALITTQAGRQVLSFAPKNGHLYGVDLATNAQIYRSAVTRVENIDAPLSTDKDTHFCPGAVGGGEWNGVAYDPETNLIFTGETEWCTTVKLQSDSEVKAVANGSVWMGSVKTRSIGHCRKTGSPLRLGRLALCHRRRQRHVEMESQDQLSHCERHNPHRRSSWSFSATWAATSTQSMR